MRNSMDDRPPSMRHRAMKDELGTVDIGRGTTGGRQLVRGLPAELEVQIATRNRGAERAVGFPLAGFRDIEAVRSLGEKLDAALAGSSAKVIGPLMSLLTDNPFEVMAPDRNYLVCRTIAGTPPAVEGLVKMRLDGGTFLVVPHVGDIDDLEPEYGFVFGQWLPKNGYEVAKLQIREVYPQGLEIDDPTRVPMELFFPLSLRLSKDEPPA